VRCEDALSRTGPHPTHRLAALTMRHLRASFARLDATNAAGIKTRAQSMARHRKIEDGLLRRFAQP
jgi:hypothetical protein